jgi:formylglycine-generating enzyme
VISGMQYIPNFIGEEGHSTIDVSTITPKFITICSLIVLCSCAQDTTSQYTSPKHTIVAQLSTQNIPTHVPCPDDMVEVNNFCIDIYEAPNQKGVYPFYAQTAYQGVAYCRSVGKELCTQQQWQTACAGPSKYIYPYGNVFRPGICNDNKHGWVKVPWLTMGTPVWDVFCRRQYKGEQSGSMLECVSDYGVYDTIGNVNEWVKDPLGRNGYSFVGGYWYGTLNGPPRCSFAIRAHSAGFNSYEVGYRCCQPIR